MCMGAVLRYVFLGGFGEVSFFQRVLLSNSGWLCVLVDGYMFLVMGLSW